MSNIDKQALREVAENAKSVGDISRYEAMTALTEFEAAAKPATVLALLDELELMALAHLNLNILCDVYRSAYEEARHDGLVNWEAASSLAEENEELKRKLEAAEKRIAELEVQDIHPVGIQFITEAIGAHGYIVGCLQQNRPDLALEESLKWVSVIGQAAEIASKGE